MKERSNLIKIKKKNYENKGEIKIIKNWLRQQRMN